MARSRAEGLGLGDTLMETIIAYARDRGVGAIVGDVLSKNTGMLAMCRDLGVSARHGADDPRGMRARLDLTDAPATARA